MTDPQFDQAVPHEVRDFADRSVEQARKAFGGFIGAITEAMQGEAAPSGAIPTQSLTLSRLAVDFADRNIQGAFEFARSMVHATDLSQMLDLQRAFLEEQMKALKSQMRTLDTGAAGRREERRKAG